LHDPPDVSLKLANYILGVVPDVFNYMIDGFNGSMGKLPERWIEESRPR
tara:strand:- start:174 stop:320 length:147 start_codon:yes stop_codon:yes gene_type:complete